MSHPDGTALSHCSRGLQIKKVGAAVGVAYPAFLRIVGMHDDAILVRPPVLTLVCLKLQALPKYSHAPYNDFSVNDGPHIRRWPHKIII